MEKRTLVLCGIAALAAMGVLFTGRGPALNKGSDQRVIVACGSVLGALQITDGVEAKFEDRGNVIALVYEAGVIEFDRSMCVIQRVNK